MRNSWRLGPHSSACSRFLDKKRDHSLKAFPVECEVCGKGLSQTHGTMVICANCRTRYFALRSGKVKVLTSYEHEFKTRYHGLAGVDPSSDIKRLIEEEQDSAPRIVEKAIFEKGRHTTDDPDSDARTVMLFPGDTMLSREGRLYVFKRRSVESLPLEGSTLVDYGGIVNEEQKGLLENAGMAVRSIPMSTSHEVHGSRPGPYDIAPAVKEVVRTQPEFVRRMALAMANSAIHATERVGSVAHLSEDRVSAFTNNQRAFARRLERAPPGAFLVYEAVIMKEYWGCYHMAVDTALQRSGPRKKARFVREFVPSPTGRARGYTAMDAAINYLHQRRLAKATVTNQGLGLSARPGEGFLHRKRWNPEGLGLVLDLIDPLKFADREKLLEAILDVSLNWRDFYSSADRHGARFYYPRPEAVGVLEAVGEAADRMQVSYRAGELTLVEAYRTTMLSLIRSLQSDEPVSFTPFVY